MKPVRLLPVVIFASCSLLVFKSVGLLTNGGYVLSGPAIVKAAGGGQGGNAAKPEEEQGAAIRSHEPTIADTSPMLTDTAPTILSAQAGPAGHGAADAPGAATEVHGAAAEDASAAEHGEVAVEHAASGTEAASGHAETEPGQVACASDAGSALTDAGRGAGTSASGSEALPTAIAVTSDCPVPADAVAMVEDGSGNLKPLTGQNGASLTEMALLERLSERRSELDAFEAELELRSSLVEATEKRIAERTAALAEIEARISAMVDEKKALEESQFKSIVAMYETMKPAEAAAIFNSLDMGVLLNVARTMSARKMAPILAKMSPEVAQRLTVMLATDDPDPQVVEPGEDLASLPQIVGQ